MGCYADPYNIPTHLLEILNSTHFKDYYSKPSTCYGNLILTLTGRKKSITPPPFGKIAAPIFKSPKIFRRHRFYIGDPKIGRPGGAPGKHPFFARTCNCIHGRDRWDPMRPLFPFPGHTKGAGRSIPFLWCVARQAGTPVICSTTQPYSSASNQTLTGKGV